MWTNVELGSLGGFLLGCILHSKFTLFGIALFLASPVYFSQIIQAGLQLFHSISFSGHPVHVRSPRGVLGCIPAKSFPASFFQLSETLSSPSPFALSRRSASPSALLPTCCLPLLMPVDLMSHSPVCLYLNELVSSLYGLLFGKLLCCCELL